MAVPNISLVDLTSFHENHFKGSSRDHFATNFLGPEETEEFGAEDEVEDDGLGYYPDGVKRTLTDEQIAIFRHTEIEALLRERRHAAEAREHEIGRATPGKPSSTISDLEDGELEDELPESATPRSDSRDIPTPPTIITSNQNGGKKSKKAARRERKAQFAKDKGFFKKNIKPDLRKRTWDKVDSGMDSLAYDEEGMSAAAPGQANQRRRITYDDD